jgi:hypothetical protein
MPKGLCAGKYELHKFDANLNALDKKTPVSANDLVQKKRLPIIVGEYPEYTEIKTTTVKYRLTESGWKTIELYTREME